MDQAIRPYPDDKNNADGSSSLQRLIGTRMTGTLSTTVLPGHRLAQHQEILRFQLERLLGSFLRLSRLSLVHSWPPIGSKHSSSFVSDSLHSLPSYAPSHSSAAETTTRRLEQATNRNTTRLERDFIFGCKRQKRGARFYS